MKIKFVLFVIVTCTALCCTSCTKKVDVQPDEITSKLLSEIEFPSPAEKGLADVADYYDIPDDGLKDASFVLCGSGAYPDEIAVFKFESQGNAENASTALEKRLSEQKELYGSYTPDEMYKLEGAFITVKSNYAILCAVADNERALQIIESFF